MRHSPNRLQIPSEQRSSERAQYRMAFKTLSSRVTMAVSTTA